MADQTTDSSELAKFGYRQELDRSLGRFSSFAAGFSYISILTGVFQLFFFGFSSGGPAFFWTWPTVLVGQLLVALCFAELAGQFPLAGSVYQWAKQIARPFTSWMAGWIMLLGSVVTIAAVAVAYQVILPQISDRFQIVGGPADVGVVSTPDGARNAVILALGLLVFTTVVNMIGVRLMAHINNVGVAVELVGVAVLIVLLAVHSVRGPGIVTQTFGTGDSHPTGYLGAFLVAGLMSAYVLYGFDTAGSLAEETLEPRRHAPPAILRALLTAGLAGALVLLFALMAVPNVHAQEIATSGLPYIVKATLGEGLGDLFLTCSAIAITVCCLACHTGGIRMMFAMGRDNRLPFGPALARVSERSKTPVVPAVIIGIIGIGLLLVNIGNQRVFFVLTSVAIILFYLAYLCVTGPLLIARLTGRWPRPDHGPHFSLGRWGLPVNLVAVAYQVLALVNLAWPRPDVYGGDHWYYQWGAFVFCGAFGVLGAGYYLLFQRGQAGEDIGPASGLAGEIDLAAAPEG
jgi:urea carboxylase system permease